MIHQNLQCITVVARATCFVPTATTMLILLLASLPQYLSQLESCPNVTVSLKAKSSIIFDEDLVCLDTFGDKSRPYKNCASVAFDFDLGPFNRRHSMVLCNSRTFISPVLVGGDMSVSAPIYYGRSEDSFPGLFFSSRTSPQGIALPAALFEWELGRSDGHAMADHNNLTNNSTSVCGYFVVLRTFQGTIKFADEPQGFYAVLSNDWTVSEHLQRECANAKWTGLNGANCSELLRSTSCAAYAVRNRLALTSKHLLDLACFSN